MVLRSQGRAGLLLELDDGHAGEETDTSDVYMHQGYAMILVIRMTAMVDVVEVVGMARKGRVGGASWFEIVG